MWVVSGKVISEGFSKEFILKKEKKEINIKKKVSNFCNNSIKKPKTEKYSSVRRMEKINVSKKYPSLVKYLKVKN